MVAEDFSSTPTRTEGTVGGKPYVIGDVRVLEAARTPIKPQHRARRPLAPRTVRARFIRLSSTRPKIRTWMLTGPCMPRPSKCGRGRGDRKERGVPFYHRINKETEAGRRNAQGLLRLREALGEQI